MLGECYNQLIEKAFEDCVDTLNAKLSGCLFFVEIGAMDGIAHDSLHKHIISNPGWTGVLVEPLPDMFQKLQENYKATPGLRFENTAITDTNGQAQITRIPSKNVGQECPEWADGISTLKPEVHIISRYENLKPYAVQEPVTTMTFPKLVEKHHITNIDLLQIDTEGYDKEIFDQIWTAGFRPGLIKFEILYLQHMVILELIGLLSANGYACSVQGEDLIVVKQ
ncbi:MAG TPA: FkbM family methyltransferase [Candidatus Saccharimonadales bacterium]|nr:FkbM family methyltransferase [Candidatus Saccharimonadales bacterium]